MIDGDGPGEDVFSHPVQPAETNVETETVSPRQIWLIEDSKEIGLSTQRLARAVFRRTAVNAEVVHFQEGKDAVAKFQQIIDEGGESPVIILMDYRLDGGVPGAEYRTGVEVIEKLTSIAKENEVQLPQIIGFSLDEQSNQALVEAGAVSSVNKGGDLMEYFKGLEI